MMSHAADVTCLELKLARKLLLHEEVPVVVRKILAVTVDRLRGKQGVLRCDELVEGVGQIRKIRRGESIAGNGTLQRIAEIVVLVGSIINTETGSDDRLA